MSIFSCPAIPIAEVVFEGRFLKAGRLPPSRGATLRGALGYHLRNTVCNSFNRKCTECFLRHQCAYSLFFEGTAVEDRQIMRLYDNVPQPFMFVLNSQDSTQIEQGEHFTFGMRIFGIPYTERNCTYSSDWNLRVMSVLSSSRYFSLLFARQSSIALQKHWKLS